MSPAKSTVFQADVVPKAPEDPLFGLMAAYRADTHPQKVDLGIGAYRDDTAKPWVLPVVKKVGKLLYNHCSPEACFRIQSWSSRLDSTFSMILERLCPGDCLNSTSEMCDGCVGVATS